MASGESQRRTGSGSRREELRLAAGRGVQLEHRVYVVRFAPVEQPIEDDPAGRPFTGKVAVIQRDAHHVEALLGDCRDVRFRDETIAHGVTKAAERVGARDVGEALLDGALSGRGPTWRARAAWLPILTLPRAATRPGWSRAA